MWCWFGEMIGRGLQALRNCAGIWVAIAVIVLAAGAVWGEEVTYNSATGALDLIQDSTWATKTAALGLWNLEIDFAGTNANNSAPYLDTNPADQDGNGMVPAGTLQIINAEGTLYADPVNGINGNGWSATSYSGLNYPGSVGTFTPGIDNNVTFVGPTTNGRFTLPVGTYLLATLPANLTTADFGNSLDPEGSTADNAIGTVVFANGNGGETLANVLVIKSEPGENDWAGGTGSWSTSTSWSTTLIPTGSNTATFGNPGGNYASGTGGTVSIGGTQNVGSLWFTSGNSYTLQVTSGTTGSLALSNTANIWIDAGQHSISVPLALSGSLTVNAAANGSGVAGLTISGQISGGSGGLTTIGPGLLTLSNTNNTYTGNTSILNGTLSAAGPGSLGFNGSGGLGTNGLVTISNATLDFSGPGTLARTHSIVLSGSGANIIQADSGLLVLGGPLSGSGGLTKTGLGTLAIGNELVSYGGGTYVNAGTLQARGANALASGGTLTVAAGGTADVYGNNQAISALLGSGTLTNSAWGSSATLSANGAGGATFAAAIQDGAGKIAVNVPSGGMLTLCNTANTFSGGSTVTSGTLSVSADANLGGPASGVALNNSMLLMTGSTNFTLGSGRAISLTGSSSLDVVSGQSAAIAGVLSGGGTLIKTDSGTLTLTNSNSYSGGTLIDGGILAVAGDSSLGASSGSVTINNGTLELGGGTSTLRPGPGQRFSHPAGRLRRLYRGRVDQHGKLQRERPDKNGGRHACVDQYEQHF